jgi:23S rRNA (cytosine1962-C5)-methyltransferase
MQILTTKGFGDYALLDSGDGYRLEQVGSYRLARPDPQIIWKRTLPPVEWEKADAIFAHEGTHDVGWKKNSSMPSAWELSYSEIRFFAKLSPFKHIGIFPEQHLHWDFIKEKINGVKEQPKILNLFAYTGIASLIAAQAGAQVTHVDASRPTIGWARENQKLSGLSQKPIRWILDDVMKFVAREVKRGNTYDGIILDPPVYGHGPTGQVWKFNEDVPLLLANCRKLLSPTPLFVIMNAYAISSSALMLQNIFGDYFADLKGTTIVGELVLEEQSAGRLLSTGLYGRWSAT